ncbi:MAG: hypothetical protein OXB98_06025 [Bryobacterales bacterium]|nr:hypothetical protein [Bryobacterales bacterium]
MDNSQFILAFSQGRSARRDGFRKLSNPYFSEPSLVHLKRTWEGGWEYEAIAEGCATSAEISSERFVPIQAPLLAHVYRFFHDSLDLDEKSFTEQLEALSMSYLPGKLVRLTVFLPKHKPPNTP